MSVLWRPSAVSLALSTLLAFALALVAVGCSSEPDTEGPPAPDPLRVEILAGPEARTRDTDARFEFACSHVAGCDFACGLDEAELAPCTTPLTLTDLEDGEHRLEVVALVGTGRTQSEPVEWRWTVDTLAPEIVGLSGPAALTNERAATFTFACSKGACTYECRLDDGTFEPCTSGVTFRELVDGAHAFEVRAADDLGNPGEPAEWRWSIDTVSALVLDLEGPATLTNQTTARFDFACSKDDCTYECTLDGGAPEACVPGVVFEGLEDGEHVLVVQAADALGNRGPDATWRWHVDTAAPEVLALEGPEGLTNETLAVFAFECSEEGCAFECRFDGGEFEACESGITYEDLADGSYVFEVRASDAAGNVGEAAVREFEVDATAPTVEALAGPAALTNAPGAQFAFVCSEDACTFECALDGGAFAPCESGVSYTSLADGAHTFTVRATDAAGNVSEAASHSWTVDTVVPVVLTLDGPLALGNQTGATFEFTCSKAGCSFECALDGAVFAPCESGVSYTNLADGAHTFTVRATDPAGNVSPALMHTWTVDTVVPVVHNLTGPESLTNAKSATFAFTCSKTGCTFECSLDGAAFAWCDSGVNFPNLADGAHAFQVRATDPAGNVSEAASHSWTVDTVVPVVQNLTGPASLTNSQSAQFGFECSKAGCAFECALDAAAFAACDSGVSYTNLTDGAHAFQVRATDAAGNVSAAVTHSWTVDTVVPVVQNLTGPAILTNATSATFGFECSKTSCTFECALDAAAFAACDSGVNFTSLTDGAHAFQVRATDAAGNVSATAIHAWTVDTVVPQIAFLATPPLETAETEAVFEFACVNESDCTFECALGWDDGQGAPVAGEWEACDGVYVLEELEGGAYTMTVRARDGAGNVGEVAWSWTVESTEWAMVSAGLAHTCGIRTDGTLWCWGANWEGQLGLGDMEQRMRPVQVGAASDWSQISAAHNYTCGRRGGALYCWGANWYGQLGVGNMEQRLSPERVGAASDWSEVVAGFDHTCGRRGGALYCWGVNWMGQLGVGGFMDRTSPERVGAASDWSEVATGRYHTCGVRGGEFYCWGYNGNGQLGLGDTTDHTHPQRVGAASDWNDVAAGGEHTCGRRGGELYCWGDNWAGQLGLGGTSRRTSPERVGTASDWSEVSIDNNQTCGRRGGELYCWGENGVGQLGLGDTTSRTSPARVGSASDWDEVSPGYDHACGRRGVQIYCWGYNGAGQLGVGDTAQRFQPELVD